MAELLEDLDRLRDPRLALAMRIRLASPERIRSWSRGEVKKSETINYRTFKPERDGLFCPRIFGPVRDFECNCGKYRGERYRNLVCEKCGVEIISARARRERLGHIDLGAPVAHVWFLRAIPSPIGLLLDMTLKALERVLTYEASVVMDPGPTGLRPGEVLSEQELARLRDEHGEAFSVGTGGEAIRDLLRAVDLNALAERLHAEMEGTSAQTKRMRLARRLQVVQAMRDSGNRPEWMMVEVLPVLPPDLRPLVPLDGGRFATSDLNDLYRRVINRNNRLKRLLELGAPEIILKNEKRMLQEAVDVLLDNGRRGRAATSRDGRRLKSLSDMLEGKQGRFRQNLLGKRVDYSGRSVIVVGPELKLHQCGLPKRMALELFKPFVYHHLESRGLATTIRGARRLVETETPEVWDALEEVTREHPVLLNRAPTLHRLGIQAFEPLLVEGSAIQLHPLVCAAFNADFDGDQMAVHVPLSLEAQLEGRVLLMSTNNILSPANGRPIIYPSQDMVLGLYFMTREQPFAKGGHRPATPGRPATGVYAGPGEVRLAYDRGELDLHAGIQVRIEGRRVATTAGRVLLFEGLPPGLPFALVNRVMGKKQLADLLDACYRLRGAKETVLLADRLRALGYFHATDAGISICVDDLQIPARKGDILSESEREAREIDDQYDEGLITEGERYNKVVDTWAQAADRVASEMMTEISLEEIEDPETGQKRRSPSFNPVFIMADSGARGSAQQIRQLGGMRGLMAKPSGEIIETPITRNFREGLSALEYFISTHGARKGLADTALKTANAGYLTRRLVDVAEDAIVAEEDCGTPAGIEMTPLLEGGEIIEALRDRILGRVAVEDVRDPATGELLVRGNQELTEERVHRVEEAGIDRVRIRSVLTCESRRGICALCYGRDLARGRLVEVGEAVGVVAAQSIGEPGTQLTMRTFHIGGVGQVRTEQSRLEARSDGRVRLEGADVVRREGHLLVMNRHGELVVRDDAGRERERYGLIYGARLYFAEGERVKRGELLAEWDPFSVPILTEAEGLVRFGDVIEGVTMVEQLDEVTGLSRRSIIEAKDPALRPHYLIENASGEAIKIPGTDRDARYYMPVGANVTVNEGTYVRPGDVLARIPRETTKTKDITGGLPRVAELFEARLPKEHATIAEIDGIVGFGRDLRGKRRVVVTPEQGGAREYLVPKGRHLLVREGDRVRAGEPLTDGAANPHDILRVLGEKALAKYLVDEVQEVYRLQGVRIDDKHVEVVVRQMLRRVRILEPGDTVFLLNEQVEKYAFEDENDRIAARGGRPARAEPALLGITKASLSTDSFIAAASFQQTTRVLTAAALAGRLDRLVGLKENVILGRLIPAGTGFPAYRGLEDRVETVGGGVEEVEETGPFPVPQRSAASAGEARTATDRA
jgi:DNA-directed RNA polymerase subunit beta'